MADGKQPQKIAGSILGTTFEGYELADGVWVVPTQGNGVVVRTASGLVMVDAGPGNRTTDNMIEQLRALTDLPVTAIVYSHGHVGYNGGVQQWLDHNALRGDAAPQLVAHSNCRIRYDRYRETWDLQYRFNRFQFPRSTPDGIAQGLHFTNPTVVFDDEFTIEDAQCPIVVKWAPSETDDSIAMWLPNQRILYGGPAVIPGFPNIGTPLRTIRRTQRWIESLEMMIALDAEIVIPEFGPPTTGASAVRERLTKTRDALAWLREQVYDRMNLGMTDVEMIHDIVIPEWLTAESYLKPNYGSPEYVIRDLYREENGWWTSRNATDLHPAHPDAVAAEIAGLVDADAVLARAEALIAAGEHQMAMHVLDLLALVPGDDAKVQRARNLKADCCDALAASNTIFVSRSMLAGSARLLRDGIRRWSEVDVRGK